MTKSAVTSPSLIVSLCSRHSAVVLLETTDPWGCSGVFGVCGTLFIVTWAWVISAGYKKPCELFATLTYGTRIFFGLVELAILAIRAVRLKSSRGGYVQSAWLDAVAAEVVTGRPMLDQEPAHAG